VHWIDLKTQEVVENTTVEARPRFVTFTNDSQQLWVSSEIGKTVTILDANSKQVIKKIKFESNDAADTDVKPVGIVIDKNQNRAYVALGRSNKIAVINAQTFEIEKYLPVGLRVWNLVFSPDQKRLYAANGMSNDVSVIDLESQAVSKSIRVGNLPWGIVVKP
jgi:YVTN family beta-propeller protein